MYFDALCNHFSQLPQIEAMALGGSRATGSFDKASDYDLYIYCFQVPSESERHRILEECCGYIELGNQFWELEDDCVLKSNVPIDILYRNLDDFLRDVASVVEEGTAHNGYTTCMWHNLLHCKILFDRDHRLTQAQRRFTVPYPENLRQNIIQNNLRLLTGNLPSYDSQIQKAIKRKDLVSVNHRTAAFLESYFDILFALNRLTHPGEKRMASYLSSQAELLPKNFEFLLNQLFSSLFTEPENISNILDEMLQNLLQVLPQPYSNGSQSLARAPFPSF